MHAGFDQNGRVKHRESDGKAFRDSVNFSRKRYHKIGELIAKPLSREERRNKRKWSAESREQEELKKALELSRKERKQVVPEEGSVDNKEVSESGVSTTTTPNDSSPSEEEESTGVASAAEETTVCLHETAVSMAIELHTASGSG